MSDEIAVALNEIVRLLRQKVELQAAAGTRTAAMLTRGDSDRQEIDKRESDFAASFEAKVTVGQERHERQRTEDAAVRDQLLVVLERRTEMLRRLVK